MKTFLFDTTVTPNSHDFWYDSEYVKNISVNAETISDAKEQYAKIIMERYGIEISKSSRERPHKMYSDTDGKQVQVGFIFTGMTEIYFGAQLKRRFVSLGTYI